MMFTEKLAGAVKKNNSLLCVGLDPDPDKMPEAIKNSKELLFEFNKAIIDATAELVCAFKPNPAFYEAYGADGIGQLQKTCRYIREKHPKVPILLDFKRGDIGNTNSHYARFAFDYLEVDAVTIQPYLGREANQQFLERGDKGFFVLCRTSNPGAGEFQDLKMGGKKLYQRVAENVMQKWNQNGNCHLVIGATYPDELAWARQSLGDDALFLVPGIGAQGGDIKATLKAGLNSSGAGLIINSARQILYASNGADFAEAAGQKAAELRDEINKYRGGTNA